MTIRNRFRWTALLLCLFCVGQYVAPPVAPATENPSLLVSLGKEIADIASRTRPAVVQVYSTTIRKEREVNPFDQMEQLFGPNFRRNLPPQMRQPEMRQTGLGSGFIIQPDGVILTNSHVVADSDELEVVMPDGKKYKATVIGSDPESEVAVIKIDAKNLPVLEIGDSDQLQVGNFVVAIGSPQGLRQTVTFGIVSATNRNELNITDFGNFIQTDADINRGNSGGPLLDAAGKVVGVSTAIISTSGGSEGLGLAIPINQAMAVARALQKSGKVERGYVGVLMQELTPEMAEFMGADKRTGAVVLEITAGAPADGVLEVNDLIVGIEGTPVKDSVEVRNRIAALQPGESVKLDILRAGKEKTVRIKLGTRPGREELLAAAGRPGTAPGAKPATRDLELGFSVEVLTPEKAKAAGVSDTRGLLITEVKPESRAYKQGVRPNMVLQQVNQKDVTTLEELNAALKAGADKKSVLLRVNAANGAQLLLIPRQAE